MPGIAVDYPDFAPTANVDPEPTLTPAHLLLLDPGLPYLGWWSQGSQTIPNIAAEQGAALVGSPVPSVSLYNTRPNAAAGLIERSSKNSPHFVSSHTNDGVNSLEGKGNGTGLEGPAALAAYLTANPSHVYYLCFAFTLTRGWSGTTPTALPLAGIRQTNLNGSVVAAAITATPTAAALPSSTNAARQGFTGLNSGNEYFVAVTSNGTTTANAITQILLHNGPYSGSTTNRMPSFLMRRYAIVDITSKPALGLSHASLSAADQAQWAASIAEGGRYFQDAYSDPAVICP